MPKKKNLRRAEPLFIRLTEREKAVLRRRAGAAGMYMVEYARCKIFDIPLEHLSGRLAPVTAQSHSATAEATKATA